MVWFEPIPETLGPCTGAYDLAGEYVVYDTARATGGGPVRVRGQDRNAIRTSSIEAVFDDYVYWAPEQRKAMVLDYSKRRVCLARTGNVDAASRPPTGPTGAECRGSSYPGRERAGTHARVTRSSTDIAERQVLTPPQPQPKCNNGIGFRRRGQSPHRRRRDRRRRRTPRAPGAPGEAAPSRRATPQLTTSTSSQWLDDDARSPGGRRQRRPVRLPAVPTAVVASAVTGSTLRRLRRAGVDPTLAVRPSGTAKPADPKERHDRPERQEDRHHRHRPLRGGRAGHPA